MDKKGQLNMNDAPSIVLMVGLTFLLLATIAYVAYEYGDAVAETGSTTAYNESVNPVSAGVYLSAENLRNGACGTITSVYNATNHVLISAGNYTQTGCLLQNTTSDGTLSYTGWKVTYPYTYSILSSAVNVTSDLETEVDDNTSIAGIILTISLVGIVLGVLIGIFAGFGRRRI